MTRALLITAAALAAALFGGCKHDDGHDHADEGHSHAEEEAGHDHGEESSEVRFDGGRGLILSEEVANSLGIKTQRAEVGSFKAKAVLVGQIVSVHPNVVANVSVPLNQAENYKGFSPRNGKLLRVDTLSGEVSGLAGLVYEIDAAAKPGLGEFVEIELESPEKRALLIPESSVLESVEGKYVYVLDGGAYRRAEIKTGLAADGFVEAAGGIPEGAEVVASPVEQLWLIELRLTKGGGHSH